MNTVTLKQLRYFDALARHGHFGRAAEASSISQPALSMQIKDLETALGTDLFERSPRGVQLTSFGEDVRARVQGILRAVDELGEMARSSGDDLHGPFKLGVIPTIAPYILPRVIRDLTAAYPTIDLQVRETLTPTLIGELQDGRLDAAILALPVSEPWLHEVALFDEAFVLVRPNADKNKPVPGHDDLRTMRLLLLEEGHCFRDQALSFCNMSALPRDGLDGSSLTTLVQMVSAGIGVTLIPEMAVPVEAQSGKVAVARFDAPQPKRQVGMVFQDWALFPHLTVGRNVGYGLPRAERAGSRVKEALDMVGLADLVDRMPETLSGGQQQRVALARAIAPRPTVLLLDEPFSNLDSALRVGVRSEVHRLLVELGITSIFVTHDQEEAFVLGDHVAVMQDGRIEQIGSPQDIYRAPSSPWIASFVGEVNLLAGVGTGDAADTIVGRIPLVTPASGEVRVLVRPEDFELSAEGPSTVTLTEYYGHDMMVSVAIDEDTEVHVRSSARRSWNRGDRVSVSYVGEAANAFV